MNVDAIAARLVMLCREGQFEQAQRELYADDAVSIEPEGVPPSTQRMQPVCELRQSAIRAPRAPPEVIAGGGSTEVIDLWRLPPV